MSAVKMTEGNIPRHLIKYAIPLLLGNLFQLTYNAVDSMIVGRFIGKDTLAAVGTVSPVMNIVILGISGLCIGSSVIMSKHFGANEEEMVRKEMATTAIFGLYFSIVLAVLGIISSGELLRLLQVPEQIRGIATTYLRITFIGAPFTFFYNAIASALKSIGDSKTPLKFLTFASVLNGVLDLILIGGLGFGIRCSAITTVVAQGLSAFLCLIYVYANIPLLKLKPQEFKIDSILLKETIKYGGITALQQSCQPIGKLLIQGSVNTLGVNAIAAFNAANRVDDFAFTPEQNISHAMTTFVAQNRGAKENERITKGFHWGMVLEAIYGILICVVVLIVRGSIMGLFVVKDNAEVIQIGCDYLGLMAVFYIFPAFTNGMQGYFRGIGMMKMTLLGTFIQTAFRVIGVYILVPIMGIKGVAFACAFGWSMMLLVEIPYYIHINRSR